MTDRPIIFSGPMVRALLDGRKTQTRRLLRPQPEWVDEKVEGFTLSAGWCWGNLSRWNNHKSFCEKVAEDVPYSVGDRLYVRESFCQLAGLDEDDMCRGKEQTYYMADGEPFDRYVYDDVVRDTAIWKPSIHMPRNLSRLTLVVTDVRVQRLLEITENDCREEGIKLHQFYPDDGFPLCDGYSHKEDNECILHPTRKEAFEALWDSLNGKRAPWEDSPWVVAITFDVEKRNIDR